MLVAKLVVALSPSFIAEISFNIDDAVNDSPFQLTNTFKFEEEKNMLLVPNIKFVSKHINKLATCTKNSCKLP